MKSDLLSRKRLKKLEESIQVEKNKLELSIKKRTKELGGEKPEKDEFIEKWDEELSELTTKLRDLREKSAPQGEALGLASDLKDKEERLNRLVGDLSTREKVIADLEKGRLELESEKGRMKKEYEAELKRARKAFKDKEAEVERLKNRLADSQNSLKKESLLVRKLNESLNYRQRELDELERKKSKIERQGEEVKKGLEQELKRRGVQLDSKEKEIEMLRKKLESWHGSIRGELDSAIEFITQQSEEIARLKAELEVRNAKIEERKELLSYRRTGRF
jgi:chromosome segregation ATPase